MRAVRVTLLTALAALLLTAGAGAAEPQWRSEQPVAAGIGVPTGLGRVGGMDFWAPNKGVLITAGSGGMPAGIYAYDGSGWYLYSTVCGGPGGGIAISGPDEFWTIAAYGEPQEGLNGDESFETGHTLCHFANGEVVASYAEPASSPEAYQAMDAAACSGPADCWFAGRPLPEDAPNQDPFHLHWDGAAVTPVPSPIAVEPEVAPMPGNVVSLAFAGSRLFEAAEEAPYLREVTLADPRRFLSLEPATPFAGPFVLSTDPSRREVWAGGAEGAVLRLGAAGFETVPTGEEPLFEHVGFHHGMIESVGAEPGVGAAWLGGGTGTTELRRITADGTLGPLVQLPQPGEGLNAKGAAERIACAAPGQCWVATRQGWLFHLGGPPAEGVAADPLMHRLITTRPRDASSRSFVPVGLPPDDSGEVEPSALGEPVVHEPFPRPIHRKPLVTKIKQRVIDKTVLQLAFTLHAKAHVQLLARYHKAVVAKTARLTLAKGRHRLRLHLDPKRWPTKLDFRVHPAKARAAR
jgi:hypothetical protein